jgi:hypothetical protein
LLSCSGVALQTLNNLCGFRVFEPGEVDERQKIFNADHASVHKDVERTIGDVKTVYGILSLPFELKSVETCEHVLRSCCYFWNLRMNHDGRYALGTLDAHFQTLNGDDAPRAEDGEANVVR